MTSTQTIIVTYVGISWRNASVEKSASTAGARLPNVDVNNRLRPETRTRSHWRFCMSLIVLLVGLLAVVLFCLCCDVKPNTL